MATTSLKLPDDVKQLAVAAAQRRGMTPHAFMVGAIRRAASAAEIRAGCGRADHDAHRRSRRHSRQPSARGGRPADAGLRELIISRGKSAYVALYSDEEPQDTVLILAIRHGREAGYLDV